MKKIFTILALLALLIVPMSAMAMSTIAESDLAAITGQSGVSINLDVTVNATIAVAAWGDSDGFSGVSGWSGSSNNAGWVGLANMDITNLRLRGRDFDANAWTLAATNSAKAGFMSEVIMDDTNWNAYQDALDSGDTATARNIAFMNHVVNSRFLTIDVATSGTGATAVTKVRIGVPTLIITMDSFTADVDLFGTKAVVSNNPNKVVPNMPDLDHPQNLGALYVGDLTVLLGGPGGGGSVDIYAHKGSGVTIDLNSVFVESVKMTASWGDKDGLVTPDITLYNSAGYVGLKNAIIQGITLNGQVTIDVATYDYAGILAQLNASADTLVTQAATLDQRRIIGYGLQKEFMNPTLSSTYVHIGLNSFGIQVAQMYAPVVLGEANTLAGVYPVAGNGLTTGAQELGVIYLKGLNATVGGWVDILAH